MMNVLLVIPQFKLEYKGSNKANYYFPLGIAYISSYLKSKGFNVYTYNGMFANYEDVSQELQYIIRNNDIEVIGIGGLTGEYPNIAYYSNIIKDIDENVLLVLGGGFVTSSPRKSMELIPRADFGIIGQGEYTFLSLIEYLKNDESVKRIPNIVYRDKNGEIIVTSFKENEIDLDALPFPDYESFQFEKIISENEKIIGKRIAPIIASRSCPFSCTFCFHPSGEKYKKRSLDNVILEIESLVNRYDVNMFSLVDELFVEDIDRLKEFSDYMNKNNLEWECCARVNSISNEVATILKNGKCKRVSLGLESASNKVLQSMKKGINKKMIDDALRILKRYNIQAVGSFIFGDIAENKESVKTTIDYYLSHPEYAIDLNLLRVFPGTYDYGYAVKNGIINDENEYIKQGCPYINISELDKTDYLNLKYYLEKAIADKVKKPIDVSYYKEHDYQCLKYKCVNCGSKNTLKIYELANTIKCFCEECAEYYHFSSLDIRKKKVMEKIEKISSQVILFPINHISLKIYELFNQVGQVKFLDDRYINLELPMIKKCDIEEHAIIINCSMGNTKTSLNGTILINEFMESCMCNE